MHGLFPPQQEPRFALHCGTVSSAAPFGVRIEGVGQDDHDPSIPKRNGAPCPTQPGTKLRAKKGVLGLGLNSELLKPADVKFLLKFEWRGEGGFIPLKFRSLSI